MPAQYGGFWGRTIRSRFGQPLTGLTVRLVNVAFGVDETLTENPSLAGYYYTNIIPDGDYDLYINGGRVALYSPISVFNAITGTGYGEGPYGEVDYGEGI